MAPHQSKRRHRENRGRVQCGGDAERQQDRVLSAKWKPKCEIGPTASDAPRPMCAVIWLGFGYIQEWGWLAANPQVEGEPLPGITRWAARGRRSRRVTRPRRIKLSPTFT